MMSTVIEVHNLTVSIRKTPLIQNISFKIEQGSIAVLIGPNGSGKTTTLRSLAGAVRHQGTIKMNGVDISTLSHRELACLRAYGPQDPAYPPDMTVEHFTLLGRAPHLGPLGAFSTEDRRKATEAIVQCDIEHLTHRKLATLSGGEKRRAALAQTLAQHAPIVLLDEPIAALDIGHQQKFLDLIHDIRVATGTTFVVALHDLTLTSQYGDQVLLFNKGGLSKSGTPSEILTLSTLETHYEARLSRYPDTSGDAFCPRRRIT